MAKEHFQTTENIPDEEMSFICNHWLADTSVDWALDWLGEVDKSEIPSAVELMWFRYDPLKEEAEPVDVNDFLLQRNRLERLWLIL